MIPMANWIAMNASHWLERCTALAALTALVDPVALVALIWNEGLTGVDLDRKVAGPDHEGQVGAARLRIGAVLPRAEDLRGNLDPKGNSRVRLPDPVATVDHSSCR